MSSNRLRLTFSPSYRSPKKSELTMQQSQPSFTQYYSPNLRKNYGLPDEWIQQNKTVYDVEPADIDWTFDPVKYRCRLAHGARNNIDTKNSFPKGWPSHVESPLAWSGEEFSDETSYIVVIGESQKAEVRQAIENFKSTTFVIRVRKDLLTSLGLILELSDVRKETFPLPTLGPILDELSNELHHGKGFFVIRGIDPQEFSREDNVILYLGISSYIGEKRGRQGRLSKDGHMIGKFHIILQCSDRRLTELAHITDLRSINASAQSTYCNIAQVWSLI
jgi:hypothetical protein